MKDLLLVLEDDEDILKLITEYLIPIRKSNGRGRIAKTHLLIQ